MDATVESILTVARGLAPTRPSEIAEKQRCIQLAEKLNSDRSHPEWQSSVDRLYTHTLTFADTLDAANSANTQVIICVFALMVLISLLILVVYKCIRMYVTNSADILDSNYPVFAAMLIVFSAGTAFLLSTANKNAKAATAASAFSSNLLEDRVENRIYKYNIQPSSILMPTSTSTIIPASSITPPKQL